MITQLNWFIQETIPINRVVNQNIKQPFSVICLIVKKQNPNEMTLLSNLHNSVKKNKIYS